MSGELGDCGGGGWTLVMKTDGAKVFQTCSRFQNPTNSLFFECNEWKLWFVSLTPVCFPLSLLNQWMFYGAHEGLGSTRMQCRLSEHSQYFLYNNLLALLIGWKQMHSHVTRVQSLTGVQITNSACTLWKFVCLDFCDVFFSCTLLKAVTWFLSLFVVISTINNKLHSK